MGTQLYAQGFYLNVCYDELALKQPALVRSVHEAYVAAGAELLETNTFGANPPKLAAYGLSDQTERINRAAAELARSAARDQASVVGALGPLGLRLEPFGPTSSAEARTHFARQVKGLLDGGVDGFIIETFSDLTELKAALEAVREASDLPVVAQMTVGTDGLTYLGTAPEDFAKTLTEWGADVIGVNCSVGPAGVLDAIERMAKVTDRPLSGQPNAGLPKAVEDRKIYLASPEYVASYAKRMVEAGARFVGGCCGTTPEHIRRIRAYVASVSPRRHATVVSRTEVTPPAGVTEVPLAERSRWGAKLARGEPDGCDSIRTPHRTGNGHRNRDALLLPGPQPPGHAVGPPRGGRRGAPQCPDHHGRSAEDGALPGGDGGLRHRLDRTHEPGLSSQSGAGSRPQPDRVADEVGDRGGGQSGRARPGS